MKRIYLHPLPLRIWHWVNGVLVIALIVTGEYLRLHGVATLKPHNPFLVWHKWMGLAMIITTVVWYACALSRVGQRRHYRIGRRDLAGVIAQARYYLISIFTGGANPFKASEEAKYNPLQKFSYIAVMFFVLPMLGVTGVLFLDIPVVRQFLLSHALFGLLGALHLVFAYAAVLFLIIHIYMTTLGDTLFSHIKAMITGYEEQPDAADREDCVSGQERRLL